MGNYITACRDVGTNHESIIVTAKEYSSIENESSHRLLRSVRSQTSEVIKSGSRSGDSGVTKVKVVVRKEDLSRFLQELDAINGGKSFSLGGDLHEVGRERERWRPSLSRISEGLEGDVVSNR